MEMVPIQGLWNDVQPWPPPRLVEPPRVELPPHARPCGGDDRCRRWKPDEGPQGPWQGAKRGGGGGVTGCRGGLAPGGSQSTRGDTIECRYRSGSLDCYGELLEEKLIPHDMEGGKRHGPLDQSLEVVVAGDETTQEVQHQGTARHRLVEIAEGVRRPFIWQQYSPTERPP
jgi:hypothetical protein